MHGARQNLLKNNCQYYIREDSQIDFATENVFWMLGGGGGGGVELHRNISQILAIIDFFKQRNYWENLVSKEEYYRQHNFWLSGRKNFKGGHFSKIVGAALL